MHQTGLSPSPLQTGRQTLTSNVGETWNPFYGHEAWHNIVLCSYHYRDTVRKGVAIGCMYVDLCFIMSKISLINREILQRFSVGNKFILYYLQKNASDAIL